MKIRRFCLFLSIVIAVLAMVVILLLQPFGISTREDNTIKIGVAVYKSSDTFISSIILHLENIVGIYEENNDVQINLNIVDSQENQTRQNRQVEQLIALGYDVLVINLVERTEASYLIDKAMNAGIPVVFFNREPVQADMRKWNKLFYVGSNAHESAELQAQIVINQYKKNPGSIDMNGDGVIQYIMLEGESRHQDAMIRTEFSIQALRDAGLNLEKIGSGVANWDRNQADAIITRIFEERGNEVELILCNNDDMAIGAIDAVSRLGLDFNNIVGIDGTHHGTAAVDGGKMLGTVEMNLAGHAQTIFDLSLALATGENVYSIVTIAPDQSIRVPMHIYVKHEDVKDHLETKS